MPKLIILHISPSHTTTKDTSLINKKIKDTHEKKEEEEEKKKSVRFSKVILVNNVKTVYLMKNNHWPGATRHHVNKSFLSTSSRPMQSSL